MARTVVFLGPSLAIGEARVLVDADVRPPAQRGDIYRCLGTGVRRIVLIDGLFHGVPAVWQREIVAALDDGIEVLGASSMGALRALELAPYGMIGRGTIFSWYRDGVIDGDDEVALLHGDAADDFRPLSEPLVNLRATLGRAVEEAVVSRDEAERLVAEAKATFYPHRSVQRLIAGATAATWAAARRAAVGIRLGELRVDLKRRDAEELLRWCAATAIVARPGAARSRDYFLETRTLARRIGDLDADAIVARARERGLAERLKKRLLVRWYAKRAAQARGLACPAGLRDELRRRREAVLVHREHLTAFEYASWLDDQLLLDWLGARPDLLPGAPEDTERGIEALGRDWLSSTWAVDVDELPDPRDLGFGWSFDSALFVEVVVTGEIDALLHGGAR